MDQFRIFFENLESTGEAELAGSGLPPAGVAKFSS